MSYGTGTANIAGALGDDGKYHSQIAVTAPTGKFVVAGSFFYDTTVTGSPEVWVKENAHRGFNGGSSFLPTQYEVAVAADVAGTLYVYVVTDDIP